MFAGATRTAAPAAAAAAGTRAVTLLATLLLTATLVPGTALADPDDPDDLTRDIEDASRELEVVVEEYNALREDLRVTEAQTGILNERIAPLERKMASAHDRIATIASAAYRTSGAAPITMVLNARSTADLADRLLVLDQLVRDEQRQVAELRATRDRFQTTRRTLEALIEQQQDLQSELAATRTRIETEVAELQAARTRAREQGVTTAGARVPASARPPAPDGSLGPVIEFAYAQLGKPYDWGSAGPAGYDCSGLVKAVWETAGVALPHNSRRQWEQVDRLPRDQLRPGDLVFYYQDISHVALYVGDGLIVHSPTSGEQVRLDRVDHAPVTGFGRPPAP